MADTDKFMELALHFARCIQIALDHEKNTDMRDVEFILIMDDGTQNFVAANTCMECINEILDRVSVPAIDISEKVTLN